MEAKDEILGGQTRTRRWPWSAAPTLRRPAIVEGEPDADLREVEPVDISRDVHDTRRQRSVRITGCDVKGLPAKLETSNCGIR
jgi:hypothetical protein